MVAMGFGDATEGSSKRCVEMGAIVTVRVYNPKSVQPGDEVAVFDRGRWSPAIVDSAREFGWVCVVGLRGRAGSASVPAHSIRITRTLTSS